MIAARHFIALTLVVLITAASGCGSSAYRSLIDEDSIPDLVVLKEAGGAHPVYQSRVPVTMAGHPEPVDVAVYETGRADADRALVFIHGILADHEAWRFVRGDLGRDHRIIMIDLPGTGASDKPAPGQVERGAYGPKALAGNVWEALTHHFQRSPPPERVTLVAHSLGGTIAILMLGAPEYENERAQVGATIDSAVLLSAADIAVVNPPSTFMELARASGLKIGLADALGILRDRTALAVNRAFIAPDRRLRQEADRIVSMVANQATQQPAQAMLRDFVPRDRNKNIDWEGVRSLTESYCRVEVPVLIVWGEEDETLSNAYAYKLRALIPRGDLQMIPMCRHSPHIERPELVIDLVRDFATDGALTAAR